MFYSRWLIRLITLFKSFYWRELRLFDFLPLTDWFDVTVIEYFYSIAILLYQKILRYASKSAIICNTGRALQNIPHKTIVLVGAMQPARLRKTDAVFNLGFAASAVQLLPVGVYIAMNGRIFDPMTTTKNVAQSRFESEN